MTCSTYLYGCAHRSYHLEEVHAFTLSLPALFVALLPVVLLQPVSDKRRDEFDCLSFKARRDKRTEDDCCSGMQAWWG